MFLIALNAVMLEAGRGALLYRLTGGLLAGAGVSLCGIGVVICVWSFRFD